MPRIPLYGKGVGPTVGLPAGGLSSRLPVSDLQAPARALIQTGEQIGRAGTAFAEGEQRIQEGQMRQEKTRQLNEIEFARRQKKIEFDFQMAERDAEDRRILAQEADAAVIATSEFLSNNTDTDTKTFNNNFDLFRTQLIKNLENKNFDKRRRRLVETAVINSTRGQRSSGANQAFGRGNLARTNAAEANIETSMNQMSLYAEGHPEKVRLQRVIDDTFQDANTNGLRLKFTPQGVASSIAYQDYQTRIIAAQTSNDLKQIEKDILSDTLGFKLVRALRGFAKTRKGEIRDNAAETVTSGLQTLDVSFEDQDIIKQAARNGDVYTGVDDTGSEVIIDFGTLDANQRTIAEFTTIPKYFKDIEDNISQDLVSTALDNFEVSAEQGIDEFALYYSEEAKALHNKTDTELAEIGVETAKQIVNDVSNNITSNDFDAGVAASRLQAMENLLSTEFGGNVPFIENVALKNDAQNVMSNIASARKSLATAAKKQNKIINAEQAFVKGTVDLESQALDLSEPEKQQAITNVLAREPDIQTQLQLLQDNGVSSEQFSKILVRGISRLSDVNKIELDDDDRQAISLFENMQVRPGMLNNHLKGDDLRRWKSFGVLSDIYGFEGALQQMKTQRDEIDVNTRMADIENQLDISIDEVTKQGFFKFDLDRPQNVGDMLLGIKNITREYIRMNIPSDDALEQAAADYFESHQLVRNIMIPKADFPKGLRKDVIDNISEIADIVVDDFVRLNPTLFEDSDLEPENIGIRPISNTIDKFYLVRDGGFLLQNENEQYVSYTVAELAKAQAAASKRKKAQALKDLNEALKGNITDDELLFEFKELKQ